MLRQQFFEHTSEVALASQGLVVLRVGEDDFPKRSMVTFPSNGVDHALI
jgi:hypothetical protein